MTNKQIIAMLPLLGTATLLVLMPFARADSPRIQWAGNKHFYKRFDEAEIIWPNAKIACEKQGAHLTTLTSFNENAFVLKSVLKTSPKEGNYFFGASDEDIEGSYKWITGESFSFSNWGFGKPYGVDRFGNGVNNDYLTLNSYAGEWSDSTSEGRTSYIGGEPAKGYICEWSADNYIASARVSDLNGNGVPEDATLYVDYKTFSHTVVIKDRKSKLVLSTLIFSKNAIPPIGIAVIDDINGNKKPEIAVLSVSGGSPTVTIKDVSTEAVVKTLKFHNNQFRPIFLSVEADQNGNKAAELTVLAVQKISNKASSQTRDTKTGLVTNSTAF